MLFAAKSRFERVHDLPPPYRRNIKESAAWVRQSNQIEANIDGARAELGANLQELERKVAVLSDWRAHFDARPFLFLGIAFAGGAAAAASLGSGRSAKAALASMGRDSRQNMRAFAHRGTRSTRGITSRARSVGLAADRFIQYAGEIIPGFMDQFHRAERRATSNGGGGAFVGPCRVIRQAAG